jgi:hypothetical protein
MREATAVKSVGSTTPFHAAARVAGMLYLVIICAGLFSEIFVRSRLIVDTDPAATAVNILTSMLLFRVGFLTDSIMLLSDVAIAILLFVLLRPVNAVLAMTAAAFRLTQASILGINLLFYYAASLLLTGTAYESLLDSGQLHALATLFLELHSYGYDLGLVFFSASNFVLGWLITKSRSFPNMLGYGLIAAAIVYMAGSLIRFIAPAFSLAFEPFYAVPFIAELSFALWLLTRHTRWRGE